MKKTIYSKFLVLWFGQLLSVIGSGITTFSLGIYIFNLTKSTTSFSLLLLCVFLPPFLLKPLGGVLADLYDRRLLMILSDLGATLGLLFILFFLYIGNLDVWQIYLGVILSSTFGAAQEPAYKATITDMLPVKYYEKASGLVQLAGSAQYLVSPLIAGLFLSKLGLKYVFSIDILTFLLSIFTITLVRKHIKIHNSKMKVKKHIFSEFKLGFNELKVNRGIFSLTVLITFVTFFVGLLQASFTPMLLTLSNEKVLGISQSIAATGMFIGSLIIGLAGSKGSKTTMLFISLFICGLFFAGIGVSQNVVFITSMGFLFFTSLPFVNTAIEVLIRRNIKNEKQGRVWANISTITFIGSILAFAFAGTLVDNIFNPLLETDGVLSKSLGQIIGTGMNRGAGLMFIISGLIISAIAVIIHRNVEIAKLEK